MRPRAQLVVAALTLVLLASCSPLDTEGLESEIENSIARQAAGFKVEVDCPEEIKAEKGNNFECTVVAENGNKATIKVIQEDGEGHVRWEITEDITE